MKTLTPREVKVINLTDLVPDGWDWFWDMLNTSSPDFTFGDNNLTLISGERFARFIDDAYDWYSSGVNTEDGEEIRPCSEEEWKEFVDFIWNLDEDHTYLNLEA